MRPLHLVALGTVLVALGPPRGWDPLPDPLGWLLVLAATVRLPLDGGARRVVQPVVVLALLTSVALFVPSLRDELADSDASLSWAASLPQVAALGLLAHHLSRAAKRADDASMTFWWSVVRALSIAVALLPVVVLGAGVTALGPPTAGAAALLLLLSIGVALGCASRPWADTKQQTPAS